MKKNGWTKRSYNAVFDWADKAKREQVKKILLSDGLDEVVARLESAKNLGVWNEITKEAAEAVGAEAVEQTALQAEKDLSKMASAMGKKGGSVRSDKKSESSRKNGALGGRPKAEREAKK